MWALFPQGDWVVWRGRLLQSDSEEETRELKPVLPSAMSAVAPGRALLSAVLLVPSLSTSYALLQLVRTSGSRSISRCRAKARPSGLRVPNAVAPRVGSVFVFCIVE
jgi:hypothetical protein